MIKNILSAILVSFIMMTSSVFADSPNQYEVIGINRITGIDVKGYITENSVDRSILTGIILEYNNNQTIPVQGSWCGKGLMELKSKTDIYDVEVIE